MYCKNTGITRSVQREQDNNNHCSEVQLQVSKETQMEMLTANPIKGDGGKLKFGYWVRLDGIIGGK